MALSSHLNHLDGREAASINLEVVSCQNVLENETFKLFHQIHISTPDIKTARVFSDQTMELIKCNCKNPTPSIDNAVALYFDPGGCALSKNVCVCVVDGKLMFIFDPGGSSLFYNGCDHFESNVEQGNYCLATNMNEFINIGVLWIICQEYDALQSQISTCAGWNYDSYHPNNLNNSEMWAENWIRRFKSCGSLDPSNASKYRYLKQLHDVLYSIERFFTCGDLNTTDLGYQEMGIHVGYVSLYTALRGICHSACFPVTIDAGTNIGEAYTCRAGRAIFASGGLCPFELNGKVFELRVTGLIIEFEDNDINEAVEWTVFKCFLTMRKNLLFAQFDPSRQLKEFMDVGFKVFDERRYSIHKMSLNEILCNVKKGAVCNLLLVSLHNMDGINSMDNVLICVDWNDYFHPIWEFFFELTTRAFFSVFEHTWFQLV